MILTVNSSICWVQGFAIKMELDISRGFPGFLFCGFVDTIIRESKGVLELLWKTMVMICRQRRCNFIPADIKKGG